MADCEVIESWEVDIFYRVNHSNRNHIFSMGAEGSASRLKNEYQQVPSITTKFVKRSFQLSSHEGVWSRFNLKSDGPEPRTGYWAVTDEENGKNYVGYGSSPSSKTYFNDVWVFDQNTLSWSEIKLSGDVQKELNGTRAALYNDFIYLFGGFSRGKYVANLHRINIRTGLVELVKSTGDAPSGRTTPVMNTYGDKLFVWGGYNGSWPAELHILNMKVMKWQKIHEKNITGRTGCASIKLGHRLICYGGTKSTNMLVLNMKTNKLSLWKTNGNIPKPTLLNAGFEKIDSFHAIFFGGDAEAKYSKMYLINLLNFKWSEMNIKPDEKTTFIKDGNLSDDGVLMLPKSHSFIFTYIPSQRALVFLHDVQKGNGLEVNAITIGQDPNFDDEIFKNNDDFIFECDEVTFK